MKRSYTITGETGELLTVEYSVTENDATPEKKKYGIYAEIKSDDNILDSAIAEERFFTYEEAKRTVDMLISHQVTPCTLLDII